MQGLLIKDSHLMTKSGLGTYVFTTVFVAFVLAMRGTKNQIWLPLIFAVLLVNGNLFYDRNSGWEKSSVVMPVSRKNIVQSKYLLFTLTGLLALVYGVALTLIVCAIFRYPLSAYEIIGNTLSSAVLMLCVGAVDLPICMLSIKWAGKKLLFALLFVTIATALWLLLMAPNWLSGIDPVVYFAVLSVFAGTIYFVSYTAACRHYVKMDL